jgi:outer membrane protein OmpA-like peptidoglycan-associated protein
VPSGSEATSAIQFDLDSPYITNIYATSRLKKLARDIEDGKKVLIRGHSDNLGTPKYNVTLSRLRAQTVQNYLIAHGAPADRISIEAVGENEPLDSNNNPVAWARNRRVQVVWR